MPELTHLLNGLRGEEFVTALRGIALLASAEKSWVRCGGSGCTNRAAYIGMQRCGAPGGPVCQKCLDHHAQWLDTADAVAEQAPYCRHCGEEVSRDHIYAVGLWDGVEVSV